MRKSIAFMATALAAIIGLNSCSSPSQNTDKTMDNVNPPPTTAQKTPITNLSGTTTKTPDTTTKAS